ncbi:TetR/AcrR family transcriptional regulator [Actinoplanes sp. NPDC051346]|uniref:TetR/AcrR family transcriptional regulator n=1 Tax=Actinoplanes sp. NPDC051346 TaxID=3155048 RepID=UPI0034131D3A
MADNGRSPRERYREQVRDEIKAHAWTQVATGASAPSLNAIAKRMGISGPALYRYFRNRDELITDLVLDAYRDLAATCRAAAAPGEPPRARLTEVAVALRRWALATPHRYLLIFGTPVPGYSAPPEATTIASSLMAVLVEAFAESATPARGPGGAAIFDAHLGGHQKWTGSRPATAGSLRRALTFWTRLHGVVSLEIAGHFAGMGFDPGLLYATEVEAALTA